MPNYISSEFIKLFNLTLTEKDELENEINKNLELYGQYPFETFMVFLSDMRGVNIEDPDFVWMIDGWNDPEIAEDYNPYPEEYSVGLILFDEIEGVFNFRNKLQKCAEINGEVRVLDAKDILEKNPFGYNFTIPFYMRGSSDSDKDYGWKLDDISWNEIPIERTKVLNDWVYFLDCATLPRKLKEE